MPRSAKSSTSATRPSRRTSRTSSRSSTSATASRQSCSPTRPACSRRTRLRTSSRADRSQARIDGLALEGEHAEDALVDAAKRLVADESLEGLDAERELANRQRPLAAESACLQAVDVGGLGVLRPVDDAEVLPPARLERRLHEPAAPAGDELERLDDHPLAAGRGQLLPPDGARTLALRVGRFDDQMARSCRRSSAPQRSVRVCVCQTWFLSM